MDNMENNIHFGSRTGQYRILTASEEENDERASIDPERLLQCPFNKNHQIRACRFPYHLVKCRKNHPDLASELKTCPFNARHLVPGHQLTHHTQTCENRISVDNEKGSGTDRPWHVPVSTWVNPHMSEDWDEEADPAASPFVWGVDQTTKQELEVEATNHFSPHSRAPSTLPWSAFKPSAEKF